MAVLGLHFYARAFSSCGEWGHSSSRCAGLSLSRPLLLWSTGSRRAGSAVVAHGPSCSAARGIPPDQGSNPCPLHWQADPQPLRHQGSPLSIFFIIISFICLDLLILSQEGDHQPPEKMWTFSSPSTSQIPRLHRLCAIVKLIYFHSIRASQALLFEGLTNLS